MKNSLKEIVDKWDLNKNSMVFGVNCLIMIEISKVK